MMKFIAIIQELSKEQPFDLRMEKTEPFLCASEELAVSWAKALMNDYKNGIELDVLGDGCFPDEDYDLTVSVIPVEHWFKWGFRVKGERDWDFTDAVNERYEECKENPQSGF